MRLVGQESEQKSGAEGAHQPWPGTSRIGAQTSAASSRFLFSRNTRTDVFVFKANEEMIILLVPHSSETHPSVEQRQMPAP